MSLEFQTKDYSADQVVEDCMTDFSIDVALQKVASLIDGLKSIHRRVLLAVKDQDKFISLNTFVGKVIEIHPVGDKSINEACIRCMQEHSIGIPLLKGKGNIGGYDNDDAGADRYLRVTISQIAKDLFFEGVNFKTLPMKETEDFMSTEPIYYIPRLPTALLFYSLTLGVGFKSEIFPLNLDNVCVLVQKFLENKAKTNVPLDYGRYANLLIPDFPIKNVIRNVEALTTAYENGHYTPQIVVDGSVDVHPNSVTIKLAPFGTPFDKVDLNIRKLLMDKKSWIADMFNGYLNLVKSPTEGALQITLKRGVDPFQVAYRLIKELSLSRGIRAIPKYVNRHGALLDLTPPQLINIWYKVRKESIIAGLKSDQISTIKQILERQTKLIVYDKWDEVLRIIQNPQFNVHEIVAQLMTQFDLSQYQAKILANSPLVALNKNSRESIQDEIVALEKKAEACKENVTKTDEIIYRDTEYFKKKYHKPRVTKITLYLGYVCVGGKHVIQFDTFEEGQELLERFPNSKIYFYQDIKKMPNQHVVLDGSLQTPKMRLPKMFPGNSVIEAPEGKAYTLCLTGTTASVVDGIQHHKSDTEDESMLIAVGRNFVGILPDGTIQEMSINDLTRRKGISKRGGKSELIYAIPSCLGDVILFQMNTIDPAMLHINYISASETKKVPMSVMGKTEFIGYIPAKTKAPWMFNIPDWANANFRYITVDDVSSLMEGRKNVSIAITRKSKRDSRLRNSISI